jgi:hypothetical protein
MSVALPSAVSYQQGAPSLPPNSRAIDVVLRPTNGATFGENSTIRWDFNSSGFIVPDSLYIRYKYAFVNVAGAQMKGVPVYTPFSTLRAYVGSNQVETISQYNQVAHMLVNLSHTIADKAGLMAGYGYFGSAGTPTTADYDGRTLLVSESGSFSAPLPCMFSNCEKYIPAFAMSQLGIELVVSTLADMFRPVGGVIPTGIILSNVELCYTQINMGAEVEAMVRSSGLTHIKTTSYVNSASTLASGSVGQVSLVYNQRLASIRSAFLFMTLPQTATTNGEFDSVDITSNNGSYQIIVAGTAYPQTPHNTSTNKAGIFTALRGSVGTIYDAHANTSINSVEFNYISSASTSVNEPAKFIVGTDLQIVGGNDYILSGISTQNSAISAVITLGTATSALHNVHLILAYDALLEVDFASGMTSVKM